MTLEEARDYCVVGCVELDLPGKEYGWHDAAYVNTPKYYTNCTAVRVYAYNTLTISSEKTIVAVKFTFVEGNVPTADDSIFSVGTYDYETFVLTVEGGTNEVMLTRNASKGHFKVASVEVVYQG